VIKIAFRPFYSAFTLDSFVSKIVTGFGICFVNNFH
jgi:hypothetical protein